MYRFCENTKTKIKTDGSGGGEVVCYVHTKVGKPTGNITIHENQNVGFLIQVWNFQKSICQRICSSLPYLGPKIR